MINHKIIERTRRTVQKYQAGSIVQPITDEIKRKYAEKNNLVFQNGQFFSLDDSGNPTTNIVNISDSELQDFQGSLNKTTTLNQINQGLDIADAVLFSGSPRVTNQSTPTQAINGVYDIAANTINKINPLAGTIMKAGGFASDALTAAGIGTDQQTDADRLLDSKFFKPTPLGLINSLGASKTQRFSMDNNTIGKVGGSYGGSIADIEKATYKANKKYGLFSGGARRRANRYINEMRKKQDALAGISNDITDQRELVDMMGHSAAQAYSSQIAGGFDARYFRAKDGGKIPEEVESEIAEISIQKIVPSSLAEGGIINEIINPTTGQIEEWVPEIVTNKLKDGGKVEKQLDAPKIEDTTQQNVIPEGSLHAHKHNMDNAEGLTKKGVPVVDEEHKQQAEIEKNEIIFTKEVTEKLEELYKIYYSEDSSRKEKDNAAIDAGKLLTKEIMLNTDDRTGIIDTLQQGGQLLLKKPTYDEWVKTVNKGFLSPNYDLKYAYEVLPFEDLEKWRKETLKENPLENNDWHLPSVYQVNDNSIVFLKKGKTAKDNPELQYEFDYYTKDPEFSKDWKMEFNENENRWYYKKRNSVK
nr:MAG TPA: hypothetical protein [Caudoviricetes sp.]